MKNWDVSGDCQHWYVELDVQDAGGHLDSTWRARASTLVSRIKFATFQVALVGALPQAFKGKQRVARSKFLPVGSAAWKVQFVSSRHGTPCLVQENAPRQYDSFPQPCWFVLFMLHGPHSDT